MRCALLGLLVACASTIEDTSPSSYVSDEGAYPCGYLGTELCPTEGKVLSCGVSRKAVCVRAGDCLLRDDAVPCANDDCFTDPDCVAAECVGFTVQLAWLDDGELPTDLNGDGLEDIGCSDRVELVVHCASGSGWFRLYRLGIAETGTGSPWPGEACTSADGADCHLAVLSDAGAVGFDEVCHTTDVELGSTTLFDASLADTLTWYLWSADHCYVWGHDPSFYEAMGCDALPGS